MERTKLLIADSDVRFTDSVSHFLRAFPDIDLVACEQNGHDALRRIRETQPDAVLFDLLLPGMDGIALLRGVSGMRNAPAMIGCTRFYSDVTLEAARTYGASYLLFKPVDLNVLRPTIISCAELHRKTRQMARALNSAELDDVQRRADVRNYIVSLGIPSKLAGCSYLTEAVCFAREDITLIRNLSRGLYLEISRSMSTTPTRVERCIRSAISAAYQSGALEGKMAVCPSNKEFINYVLHNIEP